MGTTEPIRRKQDVDRLLQYYKVNQPSLRNYVLITFGLYTALRISDILKLQWDDIYDFEAGHFQPHIHIQEQKTSKRNAVPLNQHLQEALTDYYNERHPVSGDYIFTKSTCYHAPLSRSQAYRIIHRAATETLHNPHISCHSLRKTFGYHAWKQGTPPALLMDIYNHSSYKVTKRYLGISQDERDSIYLKMDL